MRNSINVNMRHLRVFVEVARRKSFRAAADSSYLGQPGVSQAIARLEAALDVRLFDRDTRSVSLTEAGEMFFADTERMLQDFDRSVDQLRAFVRDGKQHVRVACLSSAAFRIMPHVLGAIATRYPAVAVVLYDDNARGVAKRLTSGECGIGIASDETESEAIGFYPVLEDRFKVACPAGHPLAGSAPLDLQALNGQRLILLRRDSGIRALIDRVVADAGIAIEVGFETSQIYTLLGMVEGGMGATVLPSLLLRGDSDKTRIRSIAAGHFARTIGISFVRGKMLNEATIAFAKTFVAVMRDCNCLPDGVAVVPSVPSLPPEFRGAI
jgi:DNA-binding transcriptional LysR family regulator